MMHNRDGAEYLRSKAGQKDEHNRAYRLSRLLRLKHILDFRKGLEFHSHKFHRIQEIEAGLTMTHLERFAPTLEERNR